MFYCFFFIVTSTAAVGFGRSKSGTGHRKWCNAQISSKLSEIEPWLLINSNNKPRFLVQNLPSNLQPESRFAILDVFRGSPAIVSFLHGRQLVIIGPHRIPEIRTIATDVPVAWCVCQSVW